MHEGDSRAKDETVALMPKLMYLNMIQAHSKQIRMFKQIGLKMSLRKIVMYLALATPNTRHSKDLTQTVSSDAKHNV